MIEFNRDSWHFRFIRFMGGSPYKSNLCPYVRSLVWAILKFVVYATGGLLGLFLLFTVLSAPFRDGFSKEIVIMGVILWIMLGGVSLFGSFLLAYAKLPKFAWAMSKLGHGFIHIYAWFTRQEVSYDHDGTFSTLYRPFEDDRPRKKRKPSLIGEWFRSVHNKMCPEINFVHHTVTKPAFKETSDYTE